MSDKLNILIAKAKRSEFWLWVLNKILHYTIPFNKPHAIKINKIADNTIELTLPYIRKNMNHLKGIHACALATACEYACGLLLISRMDANRYRLIMKSMKMDYKLQAKEDVNIHFSISEDYISNLKQQIENTEVALDIYKLNAYSKTGEIICSAELEWQLKAWSRIHS